MFHLSTNRVWLMLHPLTEDKKLTDDCVTFELGHIHDVEILDLMSCNDPRGWLIGMHREDGLPTAQFSPMPFVSSTTNGYKLFVDAGEEHADERHSIPIMDRL